MATYRSIAASETDADSPVTATLMEALAENPTAIAEGASGAPRVSPKATGYTAFSGSAIGTVTLSNVSAYDGAAIEVKYINTAAGTAGMTISVSDDGVTFGSTVTIANIGGTAHGSVSLTVDTTTGAVVSVYSDTVSAGVLTGTVTLPGTPISHIKIDAPGPTTTTVAALALVNAGIVA